MRACFAFTNAATPNKPASLSVFDEIGGFFGKQASDFIAALDSIVAAGKKELNVDISSPGGDVSQALAMYNGLRASGLKITTTVMGSAASAASLLFMAGDKRVMPKNTWLMLHNPSTVIMGNAAEMREAAEVLDKIGTLVKGTYMSRSGLTDEKLTEILSTDSYFTAEESKEHGLATDVVDEVKATAKFDMARAELPAKVAKAYMTADEIKAEQDAAQAAAQEDALKDKPEMEQFVALAKAAGVEAHIGVIGMTCNTMDEAKAKIRVIQNISQLCVMLKKPDQVAGFIKAGNTLDEVRAALAKADADADEHTNTAPPKREGATGAVTVRSNKEYWARYNENKAKSQGRK